MLISIYKIYCIDESIEDIYIGSTKDIHNRIKCHKTSCNNIKGKVYNLKVYQFIRAHGGFDNWLVEVIHERECEDGDKYEIEQEYINLYEPKLNSNKSYRTEEQKKEYTKQYRINNKEKIKKEKRESHIINKEKTNKRKRENYFKNKEKMKQQKRESYIRNKEKVKKKRRE